MSGRIQKIKFDQIAQEIERARITIVVERPAFIRVTTRSGKVSSSQKSVITVNSVIAYKYFKNGLEKAALASLEYIADILRARKVTYFYSNNELIICVD